MDTITAVWLGVLQGLTEFLPVSSSGHLILAHNLFGEGGVNSLAFDAILHLATVLAVIVYFRKDVWVMLQTILRKLGRLPVNERDSTLVYAIVAATIPAVLLGLSLETIMSTLFRSPLLVAAVLVVGSLLLILAEWQYSKTVPTNQMSIKKGMLIGLFQSLALVPGMSRSGASIAGGMLMGLSREESARFAFLIAIPLLLGAGSKKLLDLLNSPEPVAWLAIGAGSLAAFFVGIGAIHFMLSFVRRHTLWPFIWYRLLIAAFVVYIVLLG